MSTSTQFRSKLTAYYALQLKSSVTGLPRTRHDGGVESAACFSPANVGGQWLEWHLIALKTGNGVRSVTDIANYDYEITRSFLTLFPDTFDASYVVCGESGVKLGRASDYAFQSHVRLMPNSPVLAYEREFVTVPASSAVTTVTIRE